MGHLSDSHLWDVHRCNMFLLTQYGPEEPVSVSGCYTKALFYADGPERPECRSRSRAGLTGRDFKDLRACLRHRTAD